MASSKIDYALEYFSCPLLESRSSANVNLYSFIFYQLYFFTSSEDLTVL